MLAWLLWDWACPSCAPPAALVNVVEPGHWVNLKRRYQRIRMAAFRVLHPKLLTWVPSDGPWVIGAVVSLCGLDPAGFMKGSMCVPSTSGSSVSSSSSTRSSVPLPSPLPPRVPKQPSSTATHQRRMYSAGRGRAGIRRAAQDLGALSVLTVCTRKCVEVGVSDPFLLTFRQSVLDLLPVILDSACIRAGEIDFSGDTRAVDDAAVCIGACVSVGQLALSAPEQPSFGTSIGKIVASLGQLCRCDQQQLSSRALTGHPSCDIVFLCLHVRVSLCRATGTLSASRRGFPPTSCWSHL